MKRASIVGAMALCAGLAACGGNDRSEESAAAGGGMEARPAPITVTGCLTASGDRFVLTDLEAGAADPDVAQRREDPPDPAAKPRPTTEAYQLVGNEDQLRPLVGQQVRVNGEAEPPHVAEVRELTPPAKPGEPTGTAGQEPTAPKPGEPQVNSMTETRLEVATLRVMSVVPTGDPCMAATGSQPPRR